MKEQKYSSINVQSSEELTYIDNPRHTYSGCVTFFNLETYLGKNYWEPIIGAVGEDQKLMQEYSTAVVVNMLQSGGKVNLAHLQTNTMVV